MSADSKLNHYPSCDRCGEPIDPDTCWCGDPMDKHCRYWSNHAAIPMGCVCGFSGYSKKRQQEFSKEFTNKLK